MSTKMIRYILNDYLINLNPRNIKKEDFRYLFLYIFCLVEISIAMEVDKGIFFYAYIVSAMIGIAMLYLCGRSLPKIFYLLPISKKERKEYVIIGFKIRVIVPIIFYLLCAGVLLFLEKICFLDYITGFLMLFLCNAALQTASGVEKVDDFIGAFQFFIRTVMIGGFFIYYVLYESKMLDKLSITANRTLLIIWYVIIIALMPLIIKYTIKYYKNMVRGAADYEYTN